MEGTPHRTVVNSVTTKEGTTLFFKDGGAIGPLSNEATAAIYTHHRWKGPGNVIAIVNEGHNPLSRQPFGKTSRVQVYLDNGVGYRVSTIPTIRSNH